MKYSIYIFMCAMLLLGCFKDEVDIDSLNFNPYDPIYEGWYDTTFVEPIFDSTLVIQVSPPDYRQTVRMRVRNDLFPAPIFYYAYYRALPDTAWLPLVVINNEFAHLRFDVTWGDEYCYDYKLVFTESFTTNTEHFCFIAD